MQQPRAGYPGAAQAPVPQQLQETLEWLIQREEYSAAQALLRAIGRVLPVDDAAASDFLASGYCRSKDYLTAVTQAMHTLALLPDSIEATFNAAKCQNSAGNPAAAEKLMARVVAARPSWIDPKIDLAVYIGAQGHFDEAWAMLESILEVVPESDLNSAVVRFNLGWHYIRRGEFKRGMGYLGIGRSLRIWGAAASNYPRPKLERGTDVQGKTVLLCGEGGAGDEIINVRFAQVIQARGGRAQWLPSQSLAAILGRAQSVERVVTRDVAMLGAYDYWAPAMDLPHLLELDLHELPHDPYLRAAPDHLDKWRRRLPAKPGRLKVGLRWQGNALYDQDLRRSIPFSLMEQLTAVAGIDFYSLQRDEGSEQFRPESGVIDLGPELETWDDTAAAIMHLDLVISSCTSVPHLAGALGKPVWIISPLSPYYIWATPGATSPWYPSVRLFRQTQFDDWQTPMTQVKAQLEAFAAEHLRHPAQHQDATVLHGQAPRQGQRPAQSAADLSL